MQLDSTGSRIMQIQSPGTCPFQINSTGIPQALANTFVWFTCQTGSNQLVLTIVGEATVYEYQQLLQTVAYSNDDLEPDKDYLDRTILVCIIHAIAVFGSIPKTF